MAFKPTEEEGNRAKTQACLRLNLITAQPTDFKFVVVRRILQQKIVSIEYDPQADLMFTYQPIPFSNDFRDIPLETSIERARRTPPGEARRRSGHRVVSHSTEPSFNDEYMQQITKLRAHIWDLREITLAYNPNLRFQASAMDAFQEAAEAFLVGVMEGSFYFYYSCHSCYSTNSNRH